MTLPTLSRARALILHNGQILLMKRNKPDTEYYALMGGKVEPGETPEQACVREVMEECGVTVELVKQIHSDQDVFEGVLNTHYIYLCTYISGTPALSGEELERNTADNRYEPMWVPIEKLADLPLQPRMHAPYILSAVETYK